MGRIIIQPHTTKFPLQLIGEEAGVCWGADTSDVEKNIKRARDCIASEHGRTWEFPQVFMVLDGYSARVIREFYTHIGGSPTRVQSSTRYIDYETEFQYVTPPSIERDREALVAYQNTMNEILKGLQQLERIGSPREDIAMLLPLGMTTKVVCRTNFRNLVDMSHQRMCSRAYWEFRELFNDINKSLCNYSDEWKEIVTECFKPKCEVIGYCKERKSCGRKPRLEDKK